MSITNDRAASPSQRRIFSARFLVSLAMLGTPWLAAAAAPKPGGIELTGLTVEDVQAGFASGRFSAEALAEASLDRISTYDPYYNAIIFLNPDALANARAIDRRRAAGEVLGPLAGVPIVIKDTIDMVGFPTTAGWSLLYSKKGGVDLMPLVDAPVVARLRASGAVILGKTNVPILSHSQTDANNSWAGPTLNAVMTDRVPGASSTGTATAVAASMSVLGVGEETAGSIQSPASAQGLVAVKPTLGLVANTGVVPLSGNRDAVGPITRTVRDAALLLDVLAGCSSEDPKTMAGVGQRPTGGYTAKLASDALAGKRIGLYGPGWRNEPLSAEASQLYERVKTELKAQKAILVEDPFAGTGFAALREVTPGNILDSRGVESFPYDLQAYLTRLGPDAAVRTFADFVKITASAGDLFGPGGQMAYEHALPQFAAILANPAHEPDLSEFIAAKEAYLTLFNAVLDAHEIDALIFPQMLQEIPTMNDGRFIRETTVSEINIAGLPGVVVPAGYYASGAPFGLIIVGRAWSEGDLLAYAYAYEQATKHRKTPLLYVDATAEAKGAGTK